MREIQTIQSFSGIFNSFKFLILCFIINVELLFYLFILFSVFQFFLDFCECS